MTFISWQVTQHFPLWKLLILCKDVDTEQDRMLGATDSFLLDNPRFLLSQWIVFKACRFYECFFCYMIKHCEKKKLAWISFSFFAFLTFPPISCPVFSSCPAPPHSFFKLKYSWFKSYNVVLIDPAYTYTQTYTYFYIIFHYVYFIE